MNKTYQRDLIEAEDKYQTLKIALERHSSMIQVLENEVYNSQPPGSIDVNAVKRSNTQSLISDGA